MTAAPPATPPQKPPSYFGGGWFRMGTDAPQFRVKGKFQFEFHNPDEGDPPELAAPAYAGELAGEVAAHPLWLTSGGWKVSPGGAARSGDRHTVPFEALHPATDTRCAGAIEFSPDPSHWVRIDVSIAESIVFTGFFDRVYEEFDVWPPDASGEGESPGRIGKRKNWVSLAVSAWPQLAAIITEPYFTVELPED